MRLKTSVYACISALPFVTGLAPLAAADGLLDFCTSATGDYVVTPEGLFTAEAFRSQKATPIKHRRLSEIVLSESAGYCVAKNKEDAGKKYPFERKQSVIKIEFVSPTTHKKTTELLLCAFEETSDPANVTCGPDTETSRRTLVPKYDQR